LFGITIFLFIYIAGKTFQKLSIFVTKFCIAIIACHNCFTFIICVVFYK